MELNNLSYQKGSRGHREKVVGRGYGSGMGKRSTRGTKGQHSRKSGHTRQGFEGGQTPIYRRLGKVGFNNDNFANKYEVIGIEQLIKLNEKEITKDVLISKRIISKSSVLPIKIISSKIKIEKPLTVHAHKFTVGAKKLIEASNGKCIVIPAKPLIVKNKTKQKTKKIIKKPVVVQKKKTTAKKITKE